MLYLTGDKTYIQYIDIRFIKEKLLKYPETLRSETIFTIDEKELDNKPFEFVEITQPESTKWLKDQRSWLLVESDYVRQSIKDLEENIVTLNEGFNATYAGVPDDILKADELLDRAKTKFKIEAMEALLDNRKGIIHFHYPVLEEPKKTKPSLFSRLFAAFHRTI